MNPALGYGALQCAAGLVLVPAVLKAALTQKIPEFDEAGFDVLPGQMMQAEFAQSRAIDQGAFCVQTV